MAAATLGELEASADAAAAEEWTLASLEMVNGLVTAVPSFAAGDFSDIGDAQIIALGEE